MSDTLWDFYLPDYDRSVGWNNHGTVLQFVCIGFGSTPELAWAEARESGRVPKGYIADDPALKAIREGDVVQVAIQEPQQKESV